MSPGRCCTWTAVRTRAGGKHERFAAGRCRSPAAGPWHSAPGRSDAVRQLRRGIADGQPALPKWDAPSHRPQTQVSWAARERARYRGTGRDAAYIAALGGLAAAKKHLGSLDRVTRVGRIGVFMATSGDLFDQPRVADAVSDLFRDVFGIEKTSARLVIGVASLPLGVPIELDVIFEVAE
jgi:enamine deaminase RidA (YjgF/YER057c/UK114 family)